MRFYNQPHAYYCGALLHARSMFTHVLDHGGATVFAKDLAANPQIFLDAVAPFRQGLVVGCESMDWPPRRGPRFSYKVAGTRCVPVTVRIHDVLLGLPRCRANP